MKASATLGSGSSGSYGGGYGGGHKEDYGTNCATIDVCPDLLFGAIFAAGAAAFAALYVAITMKGRRRKRKAVKFPFLEQVQDIVHNGTSHYSHTYKSKFI